MSSDLIPPSLKSVGKYLSNAKDYEQRGDLITSAYCLIYAAQLVVKQRDVNDPKANELLEHIMAQAKDQKARLGPDLQREACQAHIAEKAYETFYEADAEDLTGSADISTAQTFFKAKILFEVLQYFGPLEDDSKQKLDYSRFKSVQISKAVFAGQKPPSGGPNEDAALVEQKIEEYRQMKAKKAAEAEANPPPIPQSGLGTDSDPYGVGQDPYSQPPPAEKQTSSRYPQESGELNQMPSAVWGAAATASHNQAGPASAYPASGYPEQGGSSSIGGKDAMYQQYGETNRMSAYPSQGGGAEYGGAGQYDPYGRPAPSAPPSDPYPRGGETAYSAKGSDPYAPPSPSAPPSDPYPRGGETAYSARAADPYAPPSGMGAYPSGSAIPSTNARSGYPSSAYPATGEQNPSRTSPTPPGDGRNYGSHLGNNSPYDMYGATGRTTGGPHGTEDSKKHDYHQQYDPYPATAPGSNMYNNPALQDARGRSDAGSRISGAAGYPTSSPQTSNYNSGTNSPTTVPTAKMNQPLPGSGDSSFPYQDARPTQGSLPRPPSEPLNLNHATYPNAEEQSQPPQQRFPSHEELTVFGARGPVDGEGPQARHSTPSEVRGTPVRTGMPPSNAGVHPSNPSSLATSTEAVRRMSISSNPPLANPELNQRMASMTNATAVQELVKPDPVVTKPYEPSVQEIIDAQKCAKYAASALDYPDVRTAISELEKALNTLRGKK